MAEFFNRQYAELPTTAVEVFSSTIDSTIILSLICANRDGLNNADITCSHRASNGSTIKNYIGFTLTVPADASLELLANKYILPSGDKIFVESSSSGVLDISASYVEV